MLRLERCYPLIPACAEHNKTVEVTHLIWELLQISLGIYLNLLMLDTVVNVVVRKLSRIKWDKQRVPKLSSLVLQASALPTFSALIHAYLQYICTDIVAM